MKKKLLALFCAVTSMAFFAGCFGGGGETSSSDDSSSSTPTHTHTWATDWSKDATGHWHACTDETCEEKSDSAAHTPNADDDDCTTAITCSVCGYETTAAATEHSWDDGVETTPATGTQAGVKTFTCETCGKTQTEDIAKLEQYVIKFNADGGDEVNDVTVTFGDAIVEANLPTTTKTGFEFLGWYAQNADNGEYTVKLGVDMTTVGDLGEDGAEVTVKALWKVETYAVTFNTNGAGEIDAQEIEANQKATKPADPNKEGAIFTGWTKDGVAFDFDTVITEDVELTAAYETWTVEKYGSTDFVTLTGEVEDSEAHGGKAYKATLSPDTATNNKGIKLIFGGENGIDISGYAHVFIRLKIVNPVNKTNCTLRVSANTEPTSSMQGYPYYDPVASYSSDIYRHYFSYDIKNMTNDTTLKTLYIARTGAISAGEGAQIEISIDHIDFVEDALILDNVSSIKNDVSGGAYTVTDGTAYSQKDIIQTNKANDKRAAWLGWDFDIYTGKYAFVGNFRQATNDVLNAGSESSRSLTLTFDNIDVTQYEHIYVRLKNYNTDSEYPANCTVSLSVNGDSWQNVPTADWNKNDVASGAMYTGYFDYDICSIEGLTTLSSFTMYRLGAVNGYNYGIMMYIESITFVPKAA